MRLHRVPDLASAQIEQRKDQPGQGGGQPAAMQCSKQYGREYDGKKPQRSGVPSGRAVLPGLINACEDKAAKEQLFDQGHDE